MRRSRIIYGALALVLAGSTVVVAGKIIGNGSPMASKIIGNGSPMTASNQ